MAETADYDPGDWRGHDFKAARAAYTADAGRGYAEAVSAHVSASDLVPTSIQTEAPLSLTIVCDVTGSFGSWPGVIFSKLPYLDIEGKIYLGDDAEFSFAAVGDAPMGDTYPLQVRPFASGTALTDHLKALKIEGHGGGDSAESYELAALYYARNASFPNATSKPIIIFICDEGCHERVTLSHARSVHIDTDSYVDTKDIFAELMDKYEVFAIRKRYGVAEISVQAQWADLIGEDRIAHLDDPERVVDTIFGILARVTDRVDYFHTEIEGRQEPEKVATVYKSLETVHAGLDGKDAGSRSKMFLPGGAKKASSLIPDTTSLLPYWNDLKPAKPATKR